MAEPSYSNDNSVTERVCETAEIESKKTVCESNIDIDKDGNVPLGGDTVRSNRAEPINSMLVGIPSMAICGVSTFKESGKEDRDVKEQNMPTAIERLQNVTRYLDNWNTVRFNTIAEPNFR